jgi:hypothetical protein
LVYFGPLWATTPDCFSLALVETRVASELIHLLVGPFLAHLLPQADSLHPLFDSSFLRQFGKFDF